MQHYYLFTLLLVTLAGTACSDRQPANDQSNSQRDSVNARVVFHSDRDGNREIYSIAADGGDEKRLTFSASDDAFPSWSPDGRQILFQSDRNNTPALYVMDADGSNSRLIPNTEGGNYPKWSYDGRHIAFYAPRETNTELVIIDADGSRPRNLTQHPATDETPSWTLDGSRLAFQSDRNDTRPGDRNAEGWRPFFRLFTVASNGSDIREITDGKTNDENPSISPDGSRIVYQSYIADSLAIAVIDTAGRHKQVLTELAFASGSPAWSSDGSKIVFDSNRDGNFEIFVMDADGSNQRQLTFTEAGENSGAAMFNGRPLN